MPPEPGTCAGTERVVQCWIDGGFGSDAFGSMRCLVTRANRQPRGGLLRQAPGR